MGKKLIIMKYAMYILCFTSGILFMSCSNDDNGGGGDDNSGDCLSAGLVELSESLLGTYTGKLETLQVENTTGTATIVESSCRTYTIDFSDNVPSITDVTFVSLNESLVFGDPDREIGIEISADGVLIVVKTSDPIITFLEGKK